MRRLVPFLLLLYGAAPSYGDVSITMQPIFGHRFDWSDTRRTTWVNTMLESAKNNFTESGDFETDALAVKKIIGPVDMRGVIWTDLQFATHYMWQGNGNPAPPFDTLMGGIGSFLVRVDGNGSVIKLSNLAHDGIFGDDGVNGQGYSFGNLGWYWGTNQIAGDGDDVWRNSGGAASATLPVNVLYTWTMVVKNTVNYFDGYVNSSNTGAAWQSDIDSYVNHYNAKGITFLSEQIAYYDDGHSLVLASSQGQIVVPEPSTLFLITLGASLCMMRRKR